VTPQPIRSRAAAPLARRALSELAVIVRFDALVVALPAQHVSRIAMADEAVPVTGGSSVRIGDAVLPAWELGKLLALGEPSAAWLASRDPGEPRPATEARRCPRSRG